MPIRPGAGEKPSHYTQRQIANLIALETGISFAESQRMLSNLTQLIRIYLKRGQSVGIPGFGKFEKTLHHAHAGKNPNTHAAIWIGQRYRATFRPYKKLKDLL